MFCPIITIDSGEAASVCKSVRDIEKPVMMGLKENEL